jgi:MoaA/NifB/PqqE/SkfB family radical SAM enzyme
VVAITGEETAPRRCQGPARLPTISWDGKLTLCPADTQLGNRVGEVTAGSFTELWEQPAVLADRRRCASAGVPDRALCRDCPMPWSPNHRL